MQGALLAIGSPTVATASGLQTLGAANPCVLGGILVGSVATSQAINLWTQTSVTTGIVVCSSLVLAANTYTPINGYFKKGITYAVSNDTVNVTFFWVPASGA